MIATVSHSRHPSVLPAKRDAAGLFPLDSPPKRCIPFRRALVTPEFDDCAPERRRSSAATGSVSPLAACRSAACAELRRALRSALFLIQWPRPLARELHSEPALRRRCLGWCALDRPTSTRLRSQVKVSVPRCSRATSAAAPAAPVRCWCGRGTRTPTVLLPPAPQDDTSRATTAFVGRRKAVPRSDCSRARLRTG